MADTQLSAIWRSKPLLLTMVFTRCAGVCSPFLHSLKSAVSEAGGLGADYRVLVLSFDPKDTVADMKMMAESLGVKSNPDWIFGVASPSDIRKVSAATGFWFQWDRPLEQYDHPAVVVAIDRGRVVRMLAGATVPPASLSEIVQELRGKFVASYVLPGKVAFRCFEYDPNSGRYALDWGVILLLLPGTLAMLATGCVFFSASRPRRDTLISADGLPVSYHPTNLWGTVSPAAATSKPQADSQAGFGMQVSTSIGSAGTSLEER
ncbi:MAG TPA: SCO family protein [Candidatus Sulfotelmatobacter sp.]|nr:SCO family protein [Candidatus Sulfotelmatobacter sp.]